MSGFWNSPGMKRAVDDYIAKAIADLHAEVHSREWPNDGSTRRQNCPRCHDPLPCWCTARVNLQGRTVIETTCREVEEVPRANDATAP